MMGRWNYILALVVIGRLSALFSASLMVLKRWTLLMHDTNPKQCGSFLWCDLCNEWLKEIKIIDCHFCSIMSENYTAWEVSVLDSQVVH